MSPPLEVPLRGLFAAVGPWSRRELRRMQGWVRGAEESHDLADAVALDGSWRRFQYRSVRLEARVTLPPLILMDKPVGVVTSRARDGGAPTVFDVLDDPATDRVEPVGRLDRDTSGLLLLTADGRLIQRLTHPKWEVPRRYEATVRGEPDPEVVAGLLAGTFALRDGHRPHPRSLESLGDGRWGVTLVEGKYHEVRRMFAAAGARVDALRRTGQAGFTLEALCGEAARRLDETEVADLYTRLDVSLPVLEPEVREVPDGPSEG